MRAREKSNFLMILLMLTILAAGQTLPLTTNIIQASSAKITDFSVNVGGGAVDFFLP
jgi:hypothetical protein